MHRTLSAVARLLTRRGPAGALKLAGVLIATSCTDGGITVPTTAEQSSAVVAGIGNDAATAGHAGISTGAMTNGGNFSGTIAVAGQTDTWTFTATQGQFLLIAIGETSGTVDFTPWLRLKDPNGTIIANALNPAAAQIGIAAPLTGTYTVLVASNDAGFNDTGSYRLMATQLQGNFVVSPGDEGGAITNGANHAAALLVGDIDLWSVSVTAGDAFVVSVGEVTGSADYAPWIRVVAPNGAVVANISNVAAAQTQITAALTGVYTVVISTNDPGNDGNGTYTLTMAKEPGAITISPGDQGGPLTSGLNHAGAIVVGDLDAWTYTAAQGEYIVLAIGETSGSADFTPWIRIFAPNGALIGNNWGAAAAQIAVNSPVAGTYLVVVSTNDTGTDDTGTYTLTMVKGLATPTTPSGDQGGALTNGANHAGTITIGDLDTFTFTANQGEGIVLAVGEVTGTVDYTPWIRLISPAGALLGSSSGVAAAQLAVNAASTGTYQVIITTNDPGTDATGDYRLTLAKGPGTITISPGDQGGAATNGGNNLGTIDVGDLDVFTFTTNQGLPFAVNIGEVTGSANFTPWIRVLSPNGAFIGNTSNVAAAQFSAVAPLTGQYTVIVSTNDAGNDDTGDYRLIVQKSGGFTTPVGDEGGAVTNGAIHTGTIVTGDIDRWTIAANTNDQIAVSVAEVTGTDFSPWLRLVSPSGLIVGNVSTVLVSQISVTALETGNYTLAVSSNDAGVDGTGTYTLTVAKGPGSFTVSPGDQGGAIHNGVQTGSIALGDLDMWSVTANQGSAIMLTMTKVSGTADFTPWVRLVAPNGALIGNNWGTTSGTVNVNAPSTGTYTIILGTADSGTDATGNYTLSVAGVNLTPQPTMVPVVGTLKAFMTGKTTSYGPPDGSR